MFDKSDKFSCSGKESYLIVTHCRVLIQKKYTSRVEIKFPVAKTMQHFDPLENEWVVE